MTDFSKGDQVIIRFGVRQGQTGQIIKCQLAGVYEVKTADGSVLCYSRKGLTRTQGGVQRVGCGTGRAAWR
jgi:hypothetical protein